MPTPPAGAATGLPVPEPGSDGSFRTINTGVDKQEALWHVRAALNVAALGCPGERSIPANYNKLLADRKTVLAKAYAAESARGGGASLDQHMTRLYNFFAQPPAQGAFCRAAKDEAARAASVPQAELLDYAPKALERLEAPILAFYRAYDDYRTELAAWKANPSKRLAEATPAKGEKLKTIESAQADQKLGSSWRIQIGAFTGKKAAEAAWDRARARIPSLAGYKPHYEQVPGRTELVRLQLGAASDRAGALRLCATAAAGGFDCLPTARP